jgi:hypothetical protein
LGVQSDGLTFAALTLLADSRCYFSAQELLIGYYFVRPQDAKLTGIRFDVYVMPKQSVHFGINDVAASAINLLAFAPCLPQQV